MASGSSGFLVGTLWLQGPTQVGGLGQLLGVQASHSDLSLTLLLGRVATAAHPACFRSPLSAVIAFVVRRSQVSGVLAASMPEIRALPLTGGRHAEEPLRPDVTMQCCSKVPRPLDGPRCRVEIDSYLDGLTCDDMA